MCNWFKKVFGCKCECQKNQVEATETASQKSVNETPSVNPTATETSSFAGQSENLEKTQ